MGLLIGASTLTVLEVVDLVVYNLLAKCMRKGSKTEHSGSKVKGNVSCEIEKQTELTTYSDMSVM